VFVASHLAWYLLQPHYHLIGSVALPLCLNLSVNFEVITFDTVMNAEPAIKCWFKQFQSPKIIGSLDLKTTLVVSTP